MSNLDPAQAAGDSVAACPAQPDFPAPYLENICKTLECEPGDLHGFEAIGAGMMNSSWRFECKGAAYVYRHPGFGSNEVTNRSAETQFQNIARELDIDATFIHEDEVEGWKVSRFVSNTRFLDYHNWDDVARAMAMIRRLHTCGATCDFEKDMHQDTLVQMELLDEERLNMLDDFRELFAQAEQLNAEVARRGMVVCPCHNDFYDQNFLISEDRIDLIDWEFASMSDYASDLGVFIACCPDYSYEDALRVFELYFGRPLTPEELFHCVAYTAVVSFHWLVWALYKDVCGEPVTDFLRYYHRYTRLFAAKAFELMKGEN